MAGLHNSGGSKTQNRTVGLGREFHANLLFWKWAIDHELLHEGEARSAPCYTAIKRPENRHYLSDASFEAVGGFCAKRKVVLRYDLPKELMAELKGKADRRETCTITINLLEALGMVMIAWVMLELVGHRVDAKKDPILMRGDNTAALSWIARCGEARDKRVCMLTHESVRGSRNQGGLEPYCKTHSRRTKCSSWWYVTLDSCDPGG